MKKAPYSLVGITRYHAESAQLIPGYQSNPLPFRGEGGCETETGAETETKSGLGSPVGDLARAAAELVVIWSGTLYRNGEVPGLSSYIAGGEEKSAAPVGRQGRFRHSAGAFVRW